MSNDDIKKGITPLYLLYIIGTPSTMADVTRYRNRQGESESKIQEINDGFARSIKSARAVQEANLNYKVYVDIVTFNSDFTSVLGGFKGIDEDIDVSLKASGDVDFAVGLKALESALQCRIILSKKVKNISVIFISDSMTTSSGDATDANEIKALIDATKARIDKRGFAGHIDYYSVSAKADKRGEFALRYIADGGFDAGEDSRFFGMENGDSIAQVMEIATCSCIVEHTVKSDKIDPSLLDVSEDAEKLLEGTILEGEKAIPEADLDINEDILDNDFDSNEALDLEEIDIPEDSRSTDKADKVGDLDILSKDEKNESDLRDEGDGDEIDVNFSDSSIDLD